MQIYIDLVGRAAILYESKHRIDIHHILGRKCKSNKSEEFSKWKKFSIWKPSRGSAVASNYAGHIIFCAFFRFMLCRSQVFVTDWLSPCHWVGVGLIYMQISQTSSVTKCKDVLSITRPWSQAPLFLV